MYLFNNIKEIVWDHIFSNIKVARISTIGIIIDDVYILYHRTHIGDKFETYGETTFMLLEQELQSTPVLDHISKHSQTIKII